MDDPVAGGLLSDALLHQGLLGAEELHGQLVVGGLEEGLQLVLEEGGLRGPLALGGAHGPGAWLLLRGAVQAHIVAPEVHLQQTRRAIRRARQT